MTANRRLIALGALSLLLHLLVIDIVARRTDWLTSGPSAAPPAPLALRLQPMEKAAPDTPPVAAPDIIAPVPTAPPRVSPRQAAAPAEPTDAPLSRPAVTAPASRAADPIVTDTAFVMEGQMPGRYRVIMPPSSTLTYSLTRAGQAPGVATLRWTTDGSAYTVEADGVTGKLSAAGGVGDAGVKPDTATEKRAHGGDVVTTFGQDDIVIGRRGYPNSVGSQDRASLLLQLTGMGLAEPDQMHGTIAIYVAAARTPEIQRFEIGDDEEVTTPAGAFVTRHLVQVVRTGEPRLEIWLAPAQHWLPVMLRQRDANGAVSTQTINRIEEH